jgi:hypothetical protein
MSSGIVSAIVMRWSVMPKSCTVSMGMDGEPGFS